MFTKLCLLLFLFFFGVFSVQSQEKEIRDLYIKGMENVRKKLFEDAIKDFSDIIKLDSSYHQAYTARGNAYMSQKKYDSAFSDYSTALALNPKSIGNYINLSSIYIIRKEPAKALEVLQKGEEIDPEFPHLYSARASAYSVMKNYEKAIENYDKAIVLKPTAGFLTARCSEKYKFEKYEEAIADCSEAISMHDKESMAYYFRALARAEIAQKALAINDLRKALELNPQFDRAKTKLNQLLADSKN